MTIKEKFRYIRTSNHLTQVQMAELIGISRPNLSGIERGTVEPTKVVINLVSMLFGVEKSWLTDDTKEEYPPSGEPGSIVKVIMEKYELLNDDFKGFIGNQISQLLEIQNKAMK